MVHTRPHKYFVTRGRRYAKGDMKMRKRGIAAALAAVLLSLTLCGCWQEKWYRTDMESHMPQMHRFTIPTIIPR